jgi:hypothetical protein
MNIAEQFSSGDQYDENRYSFWESGFSVCPHCTASGVASDEHCAGVRMNGDSYGTAVFSCKSCRWSTSFQYDEAATPYYYETREFVQRKEKLAQPTPILRPIDEKDKKKYAAMLKRLPEKMVRAAMNDDNILRDDIDSFIELYGSKT